MRATFFQRKKNGIHHGRGHAPSLASACRSPPRSTLSGGCSASRNSRPTPAGYARLLGWLGGFGTVRLVGIEGTGSYGAAPARHVTTVGVRADAYFGRVLRDAPKGTQLARSQALKA